MYNYTHCSADLIPFSYLFHWWKQKYFCDFLNTNVRDLFNNYVYIEGCYPKNCWKSKQIFEKRECNRDSKKSRFFTVSGIQLSNEWLLNTMARYLKGTLLVIFSPSFTFIQLTFNFKLLSFPPTLWNFVKIHWKFCPYHARFLFKLFQFPANITPNTPKALGFLVKDVDLASS